MSHSAADVAGRALGAVFDVAGRLRPGKPLHPEGLLVPATVERTGTDSWWGAAWLDEPGGDSGVVRLSRSIGLPPSWPDVLGLALRFASGARHHDLLLASTGLAPGLRHVLVPRRDPLRSTYTTLFPYDADTGAVLIGARPASATGGDAAFDLLVATPLGPWSRFGTLHLDVAASPGDPLVDLDPVLNALPGLPMRPSFAALREPSYAAARRRRATAADPGATVDRVA